MIVQLSGANVTLIDDDPELTEKVIRIRGSPEQAERAQSLLQGFFLSSKFLRHYMVEIATTISEKYISITVMAFSAFIMCE